MNRPLPELLAEIDEARQLAVVERNGRYARLLSAAYPQLREAAQAGEDLKVQLDEAKADAQDDENTIRTAKELIVNLVIQRDNAREDRERMREALEECERLFLAAITTYNIKADPREVCDLGVQSARAALARKEP